MKAIVRVWVLALIGAGLTFTLVPGSASASCESSEGIEVGSPDDPLGRLCVGVTNTECNTEATGEQVTCVGLVNGSNDTGATPGCSAADGGRVTCVGLENGNNVPGGCDAVSVYSGAAESTCIGLTNGSDTGGGCSASTSTNSPRDSADSTCIGLTNGGNSNTGCSAIGVGATSTCVGLSNGEHSLTACEGVDGGTAACHTPQSLADGSVAVPMGL